MKATDCLGIEIEIPFLTLLLFIAACGGGAGSSGSDDTGASHDSAGQSGTGSTMVDDDTDSGVSDLPNSEDGSLPVDLGQDLTVDPDTGGGDGQLGEPCTGNSDCESALCWSSTVTSGCTMACASQAECQAVGLVCVPFGPGLNACVPAVSGNTPCQSHGDCVYPTVCVAEFGWCELPECTGDGDCPPEEKCEPAVRKCQVETCVSTYQCENPVEFCLDGTCGPPECEQRSDCSAGEICSKVQGICTDGTACEGECSFYNQVCVDGLCEPNLCATPCGTAGYQCNPDTGKCGPPCSGPGQCPAGWGCDASQGVCYENLPPFAVARIQEGNGLVQASVVPNGSTVTLDGTGSSDPEGFALDYLWSVIFVPPGASQGPGTTLCQTSQCQLGPVVKGRYFVGLSVTDTEGSTSFQDLAVIVVE